MGIRVLKGGMLTTVQDLGRTGYQSQGFSVSGVMDIRSFKIANLLLDNPENEAVLEFTLIGPTLEFTSETIIAITGGDFQPTINGNPAPMYTAIYMNRGDVLKFSSARTGSRGYIAFSCYLNIPVVMGSRCTNLKSKIGGLKGRKLMDGDYSIAVNYTAWHKQLMKMSASEDTPYQILWCPSDVDNLQREQETAYDGGNVSYGFNRRHLAGYPLARLLNPSHKLILVENAQYISRSMFQGYYHVESVISDVNPMAYPRHRACDVLLGDGHVESISVPGNSWQSLYQNVFGQSLDLAGTGTMWNRN